MIKVSLVNPSSGHLSRGIGFYYNNLLDELKKIKDLSLVEVDQNPDIIHYPYFDLFNHSLPLKKDTKTIVTVHDVIPIKYPDHYPHGIKGKLNFELQKLSLSSVSSVITDSYASAKDLVNYLNVPHEKINLIYLAASSHFKKLTDKKILSPAQKKYSLPKKFVLYVGDINYNKNIPTLLDACITAKIPLVLVGKQAKNLENLDLNHPELAHLQDHFTKLTTYPTRTGYVSDSELVAIYNLASIYCQPSIDEGFGIPVLEALSCGTKTLISSAPSLLEIAGEQASSFNLNSPHSLEEELKKLLKENKLVIAPKQFSWQKTAQQTFQVYENVLG